MGIIKENLNCCEAKTEMDRKKSKCSRIGNPVFPNFFFLYNDYLSITLRDREAVIFGIEKIFSRLKIGLFSSSYVSDGLSPSVYSNFHKENGFFWTERGRFCVLVGTHLCTQNEIF